MLRPLRCILLTISLLIGGCTPARTSAESQSGPLRYVALGASDAVGVGARDPERDGWVTRFHERLPAGSSLVNLGVSGSRLSQALEQQLPVAVGSEPDIVTVWLAVNDLNDQVLLDRYAADLETLLAALEQTGATVLVGNVPDLTLLPAYRDVDGRFLAPRIEAWNAAIAAVVHRHSAILVDLFALWREQLAHPEYVSADGFHPSSEGYVALADVFWSALAANGSAGTGRE